ncbi:MAG: DUF2306 domain-containing protein [Cyclobacteriaceae bacterium]
MKKRVLWFFFTLFSVLIGLYPAIYFLFEMKQGLLSSKSLELLNSQLWTTAFYGHIAFGGVALLSGFSQFSYRIRNRHLKIHKILGRIYVITVLLSGISALYIAIYATGGIISQMGFGMLAILWLLSTNKAFIHIRNGLVDLHKIWMIRSFALTFAAVMLRVWLPLMQIGLSIDFFLAYKIVAWLCWVPNLIVAELIIKSLLIRKDPVFS